MTSNWIEGPNPFGLAKPPAFFLVDMATFDPALVIFPSAEQACYRLCRRVRRGAPIRHVGKMRLQTGGVVERFDHKVLVAERLVPVISLLPHPQWGPKILLDLAQADLWRHGGADAVSEQIQASEDAERQKLDASLADDAAQRAHAAWSDYKWKTGQRVDISRPAMVS